jgi:hypothetical protein
VFLMKRGRTRAPDLRPIDWAGEIEHVPRLEGRTLLLDFFSYGDPAGVRALPRWRELAEHYRPHGLSVVGIHVPAYDFERPLEAARREVFRLGVPYPVGLDHGLETFRAYGLADLPARVLVDRAGFVRGWQQGPADPDLLEGALRSLLQEASPERRLPAPLTPQASGRDGRLRWRPSPEISFGTRSVGFGPPDARDVAEGVSREFAGMPELRAEGVAYVTGPWTVGRERIVCGGHCELAVVFEGASVCAVLSVPEPDIGAVEVSLLLDGAPPAPEIAGSDVDRSTGAEALLVADRGGVYELLSSPDFGLHNLQLGIRGAGLAVHLLHFGTTAVPDVA